MAEHSHPFVERHIGPSAGGERKMLDALDVVSLEALTAQTVPADIRQSAPLRLPAGASEEAALAELKALFGQNRRAKALIGQGYHGTHTPPVILRNLFENPGWYTSYTPYQPEISQGRLELLFHFQTLVAELTGLPAANASLLDEATAVAEAAGMAFRHHRAKRTRLVVADGLHRQSLDVLKTRCAPMGLTLSGGEPDENTAAVVLQYPDTLGGFADPAALVAAAKAAGALVIVATDPLALCLLEPPGRWGADIVVGSAQRFGVPMGFGGPHAAFIGCTDALTRALPGRLVGQSVDASGREAYRLALQTREQHIRREKATSNICTAQALLANMAAAFAIWHGPEGLGAIAARVHAQAGRLAEGLSQGGYAPLHDGFFDTVTVQTKEPASKLIAAARNAGYLLRRVDAETVSVAMDETVTEEDLAALARVFGVDLPGEAPDRLPSRRDPAQFMTQAIFHRGRSETDMMRYLRRLMDMDLALDRTMIPLGSCTMKLNAAAEMMPVSWPDVADMHPFAPAAFTKGYRAMIGQLERWLAEITGFDAVSLQPNAGSQGEFSGLMAIRAYHARRGEKGRDVCLIPTSAHGTNPASAQMAGLRVVAVACDADGNIDLDDMRAKTDAHAAQLAACMITYPSTHGVFEESVREVCRIVHDAGGQVYLDGANLNAMVGLARPGDIGADVCHMNLHKTFCIPHGGGGPGVGPIGVKAHLKPFLPGHWSEPNKRGAVAAAAFGSASILPISWMYIRMMGAEGLTRASQMAILNANYIARRLEGHYTVLYTGKNGRVAHECILDVRPFADSAGISVEDIAKRLVDYGFHAPTMSWPVAGTLMVEPTESEPKAELDRFCDAMIAVREEIRRIEEGVWLKDDNPLVKAPHTAADLALESWDRAYTRAQGCFPGGLDPAVKYWPPVGRVDNVYGDRNLVCACPPMDEVA